MAYRSELPGSLKAALKAAFLSFDDRGGLERFGLRGYAETDDAAYNKIRKILSTVNAAKR